MIDRARLGLVTLRVTDLDTSVDVWTKVVGLKLLEKLSGMALLGAATEPQICLTALAAEPAPAKAVGLFHVALQVPTRPDLADAAVRLKACGYSFSGQDHIVSESLYLSDPDGNGIEIYLNTPQRGRFDLDPDRPRVIASDGTSHSGLAPLDVDALIAGLATGHSSSPTLPEETGVGHIHMRSNQPDATVGFYTNVLGFRPHLASMKLGMFDCGTQSVPHFIAFNCWGGRSLPTVPATSAGLDRFTIELPAVALQNIEDRLSARAFPYTKVDNAVEVQDPDRTLIRLKPEP